MHYRVKTKDGFVFSLFVINSMCINKLRRLSYGHCHVVFTKHDETHTVIDIFGCHSIETEFDELKSIAE